MKPKLCVRVSEYPCCWHEVPAAPPPKLTAEELEKRGIEWPEWANWAGIQKTGSLVYYEVRPDTRDDVRHLFTGRNGVGRVCIMDAFFDASDWQNSLIQRPEKKLPDWCKVGNLVYAPFNKRYGRIEGDLSEKSAWIDWIGGGGGLILLTELREARLRPWTPEEAIGNLGTPFFLNGKCHQIKSIYKNGIIDDNGHAFTFDFIARNAVFSNSDPVGVLEHREGERWVR